MTSSHRPEDIKAAQELIKRASDMNPPLAAKYQGWLQEYAERIPKKTSSNEPGAVPQSESVDGKD